MVEFLGQVLMDDETIKKTRLIETNKYCMGAITSRGTNALRPYNQDYSAIMTYPRNDDLVMLVMADGKDDSVNGKAAAYDLVHSLSAWFLRKSFSESYINIPVLLESKLFNEIRRLNGKLYEDSSVGDASFALAVIGKKDTVIANIGNVRCYSVKGNDIELQTMDDLAWYVYNDSSLISADEVKYLAGKDYVSRTLGMAAGDKRLFEPTIKIVSNDDYDSLLLTTHGVNDVLDSDELLAFVNGYDVSEALLHIIYESFLAPSKHCPLELFDRAEGMGNMLIEKTVPGDSNASAIVYKKKKILK